MTNIAIVGAGPSGIFAADELLSGLADIRVDIFDRVPTPFGLVRYGVAPDHLKIKSVTTTLAGVLADKRVSFFGNVSLGQDISVDQLRESYDGVLIATGAPLPRSMGIEGENLPGSRSAAEFVRWYNGHPDSVPITDFSAAKKVAIVGAGNVSLDVARILLKGKSGMAATDIPDEVLDALGEVSDVYVIVRRTVSDVKFTLSELIELEKMHDVELIVDPTDIRLDSQGEHRYENERPVTRIVDKFRAWSTNRTGSEQDSKRLHFLFGRTPVEIAGTDHVRALRLQMSSGQEQVLPVEGIIRSIGYAGVRIPGVPWDEGRALIPNECGRVLPRVYVSGWIKRGPSGIIGTNKACAMESAGLLLDEINKLQPDNERPTMRRLLHDRLANRDDSIVDWEGWLRIDNAEQERGRMSGRERVKIVHREDLLSLGSTRLAK